MEKIKLNEKEYVLLEDIDKEYIKKSDINNEEKPAGIKNQIFDLMDEDRIMAMGSFKIDGNWQKVRISIDYIEKAIKSIKAFDKRKDSVVIVFSKDMPIAIGEVKEDNFSGIIVAPRTDSD